MKEKLNLESKELWGTDLIPDVSAVFQSCLGYASTPAWAFIRRSVEDLLGGFGGKKTIELGCGEGKVSLLISLLGAKTTLVDYNPKQLKRAKYIADKFKVQPALVEESILQLPESYWGKYDVSMSFGTAEHFYGEERQSVFNMHSKVLRKGGLSILWVPNRYGILFQLGHRIRRLLKRQTCLVDEIPFTRKELSRRSKEAGFTNIKIVGGESLLNDFNNHIIDVRRILHLPNSAKELVDTQEARDELLTRLTQNNATIRPWNDLLSYPLILIGRNA